MELRGGKKIKPPTLKRQADIEQELRVLVQEKRRQCCRRRRRLAKPARCHGGRCHHRRWRARRRYISSLSPLRIRTAIGTRRLRGQYIPLPLRMGNLVSLLRRTDHRRPSEVEEALKKKRSEIDQYAIILEKQLEFCRLREWLDKAYVMNLNHHLAPSTTLDLKNDSE